MSLTPRELGRLFGCDPTSAGPNVWSCEFAVDSRLRVGAPTLDSKSTDVHFQLPHDFGFSLAELEALFGDQYRSVEGGKHGCDFYFRPAKQALLGASSDVAATLWTRTARPDSAVVKLDIIVR